MVIVMNVYESLTLLKLVILQSPFERKKEEERKEREENPRPDPR